MIGYSFADPHRYASTCRIEEYHYYVGKELRKSGNVIRAARKKSYELAVRTRYAAVTYQYAYRLNHRKEQCEIARVVSYLLSALFALFG